LLVAVSWLGLYVHNVADLPGETVLSADTLYPTLVYVALTVLYFVRTEIGRPVLFGWVALQLVGGAILSVLPLPILPFHPEQTVRHYMFHLVYGVAQVPLLAGIRPYRQRNSRNHN